MEIEGMKTFRVSGCSKSDLYFKKSWKWMKI